MALTDIFGFFKVWQEKFVGSRKSAFFDQIKNLEYKYSQALDSGRDTEAATLKKQLDELRQKADFTEGDI